MPPAGDSSAVAEGGPGFAVYVHWPFCAAKCPYCDFNSHVRHEPPDQARFLEGYRRELAHFAQRMPGRAVDSIFFGGGTPSLMAPETVAGIIEAVAARWPLREGIEITLEANPTSVEAARFAGYAQAGVNRVSMGVQALRDDALKRLGRLHTADEALAALAVARRHFTRVSFDMIYARPGQTPDEWRGELEQALALAGDHLSLYQLSIEPGTAFFDLQRAGRLVLPDDDHARALYDLTQDLCVAAGLEAYEVSNHARPGAECRHNLVYWRSGAYVGVGPGAHGRLGLGGTRRATAALRHPERWLEQVERLGHGLEVDEPVSLADQAEEMLLMGLRLSEGLHIARHEALAGVPLDSEALAMLTGHGLAEVTDGRLRVSAQGRPLLNRIIAELAA